MARNDVRRAFTLVVCTADVAALCRWLERGDWDVPLRTTWDASRRAAVGS